MFARHTFPKAILILAIVGSCLMANVGQAQTLSITGANFSYSLQGDYTPSGSPAENINFSNSINLLSQPEFDLGVNPWGGSLSASADFNVGTPSGFGFVFHGLASFPMGAVSQDVAAATNYNYSILFELDSLALMDFGITYTGMSYPTSYSPYSPARDATVQLEYLGIGGWETVAAYDGVRFIAPAIDFYETVGPGSYRLSGTGTAHAGTVYTYGSVALAPAPVPEASGALLAMLAGLAWVGPRRRRAAQPTA